MGRKEAKKKGAPGNGDALSTPVIAARRNWTWFTLPELAYENKFRREKNHRAAIFQAAQVPDN